MLLESGANPDAKDNFGPALTQAIRGGLKKLEKELLEQGAIPSSMTQESSGSGQSMIELALPRGTFVTALTGQCTILHGTCKLSQATK